ncbi:selenocysteine-specific translation elongation factor [Arsenicicoccus piscis]|nr:selenocysteine-specific translation elongation factor [Arsenicicoccus piscis]
MLVVATAGHVDHGKSLLVRALTGMEPDRWAEERRRGMTIDLGYAWTRLPSGEQLAFVDVPGHQRFIGNMLAGVGPVPAVLLVVAADEGWRAQTQEHVAAANALGIEHGLVVVTRSDLADPAPTLADVRSRLADTSLKSLDAVCVSALTGEGMDELREALEGLIRSVPRPTTEGRVRLWIDRVFSVRGAGTVVTGTLASGTLQVGDELEVDRRLLRVKGIQSLGVEEEFVAAPARVAVNLRGVFVDDLSRGSALLSARRWRLTRSVDVRLTAQVEDPLPRLLMLHVGTHSQQVQVRSLSTGFARLTCDPPLALEPGDRLILRDPGRGEVLAGGLVLDADPPALARRGAGARRASELTQATGQLDLVTEVRRRGAVSVADLALLGLPPADLQRDHPEVLRHDSWLIDESAWGAWAVALAAAVDEQAARQPMRPALPLDAARRHLGVPDLRLVGLLAAAAGLIVVDGAVQRPGVVPSLGAAEQGLRALEARLGADPFDAPERPDLAGWGLGPRELAAAETSGRVLRLVDDVVLLPSGPARAMRVLAGLPQPFTASQARQALGTTRRVALPLLEHLDGRGWTRRVDPQHREVVRPGC